MEASLKGPGLMTKGHMEYLSWLIKTYMRANSKMKSSTARESSPMLEMISHSSVFLRMDTQATSVKPSIRMAQSTLEKWRKIKNTDLEFTLTLLAEGMRVSSISILPLGKPRLCTQMAPTTSAIPRKW